MECTLTATTPEDVLAIEQFLAAHPSIRSTVIFKDPTPKAERAEDDMFALRVPTAEFKAFCGGEWLTKKGLISYDEAIRRIQHHIQSRSLFRPETTRIEFDDVLTELIGTAGPVYMHQIPQLVKTHLFKESHPN